MSTHELDLFQHVGKVAMSLPEEQFTSPDDDWESIAFLETPDGVATMPLGHLMGSVDDKDMLAEVIIPGVIERFSATKVVMIMSVWAATDFTREEIESGNYTPPSQRPDRKEMVTIIEYTAEGVTRYSMAEIIRHESAPPTLAEWEDSDAKGYEGRFVDPIVDALKAVNP